MRLLIISNGMYWGTKFIHTYVYSYIHTRVRVCIYIKRGVLNLYVHHSFRSIFPCRTDVWAGVRSRARIAKVILNFYKTGKKK